MAARRRAFTLIEMLVVIGIIGILITIGLVVGNAVTAGGRQRLTQDTIRVLDASLESFVKVNGSIPDPWIKAVNSGKVYPVADARNMSDNDSSVRPQGFQVINSGGLYITQAFGVPDAKAAITGLPSRAVRQTSFKMGGVDVTATTPLDAWGRPIRYVHPAFQGVWTDRANPSAPITAASTINKENFPDFAAAPAGPISPMMIRRNKEATVANPVNAQDFADSDGGRCPGNRPYFYSVGDDGLADTTGDNVYSTPPAF